jgi:outer membrane biosynthesis protein TonB
MDATESMIIGAPPDIRRTAAVSIVGHLLLLLLLSAVPLLKMPARDVGSYQVVLVSPSTIRHATQRTAPAPPSPPQKPAEAAPKPIPPPPVERMVARAPSPAVPRAMPPPVPPVISPAQPPARQDAPLSRGSEPGKTELPVAPSVPAPKTERLSDLIQQNMREITLPKEVAPSSSQAPTEAKVTKPRRSSEAPSTLRTLDEFRRPEVPMDATPPQPSPMQIPRQEAPAKTNADKNLLEALRKAEESLNKPAMQAPPPPGPAIASAKPSRTAEEVTRQLNQLSVPKALKPATPSLKETEPSPLQTPQPSLRDEVTKMLAMRPVPVLSEAPPVPKGEPVRESAVTNPTPGAIRAATLERCPPRARRYCPLLEAAINRLWNSDYNPAVRRMLESAGDSATLISLEIRPDGLIQNIAVQESSGNKGYDLAIQSLLRDQKQFPPLPEELKNETFKAITSFKYTRKT